MTQDDRRTIAGYAERLESVYKSSSAKERHEGKLWYEQANAECRKIAKEHGFAVKRVCYATAAVSNNKQWEANVNLIDNIAYAVKNGLEPYGHFATLLDKAVRILRDGDFKALSGPKVIPFARAIYRPHSSAAVIDRWMARAAGLDTRLTPAKLRFIQTALRRVARKVRRPVSDVQAIVWIAIRNQAANPLPF